MSGFKDKVASDTKRVFLNTAEFAELRTVIYGGEMFDGPEHNGIPVVITHLREKDRQQSSGDHAQGLFLVTGTMYCSVDDLGGNQPEKGQRIKINDQEGNGGFFQEFFVAASSCTAGMLRVELEAIDE